MEQVKFGLAKKRKQNGNKTTINVGGKIARIWNQDLNYAT